MKKQRKPARAGRPVPARRAAIAITVDAGLHWLNPLTAYYAAINRPAGRLNSAESSATVRTPVLGTHALPQGPGPCIS